MANFSEILGKLSKKHGGKPSQPEPSAQHDLQPSRQVPVPESLPEAGGSDRFPGPVADPTEQISKSVMARIFHSVIEASPEAPVLPRGAPPPAKPPPQVVRAAAPPRPQAAKPARPAVREPVKGFRNHAELLKFASLIINDTEDLLGR